MFNETSHFSLCGVVRERLLPCRVAVGSMGCIVYTDYVYPAYVPLPADITCLLFLFRKCCCCFLSLFSFLFTIRSSFLFFFISFFIFGLLAVSYPLVSLPD